LDIIITRKDLFLVIKCPISTKMRMWVYQIIVYCISMPQTVRKVSSNLEDTCFGLFFRKV